MGVYVKGMEMPKSCCDCDIGVGICNRYYDPNLDIYDAKIKRHPDCPLVEVKAPHGDLIDRDAFLEDMNCGLWDWSTVDGITATTALKQTMGDLRNTPTVLEAEGKDDG